ncbi:hypothetical protein [Streptomyces sp. CAI-85]|uniref:hypothetical protein n=1 Tax=Streptomyces sp. CAI-85 TaxID=1472662 RepID=UPI0015876612|nr:hypothetical protein [Streptomyces sp. CAI-85]NUV60652.1 hypothetical protein [Streptomyces sp. CAI-85]
MTIYQPKAAADGTPVGIESPSAALAAARAPWQQLREALRQILDEQPTDHLVRTTARRISTEVQMTADTVINVRGAKR